MKFLKPKSLSKTIFILFVRFYQNTIGLLLPPSCRYVPSCSQYMIDAINKYGPRKGSLLGIKRIISCHPYSKKDSWDPVK